jgi:hypothetical protein
MRCSALFSEDSLGFAIGASEIVNNTEQRIGLSYFVGDWQLPMSEFTK